MTSVRTALIICDDALLRGTLRDQLQAVSYFDSIDEAVDGAGGLAKTEHTIFDMILLDTGLPDMDSREVCRTMRERGVRSPIIILTVADSDKEVIDGHDAGANDYITKPFRLAALLTRVHAHLRQHDKSDEAIFVIGPYKFHPSAKNLVHKDGKKTRLTEKETAILKHLYCVGQKTVPRETLLGEVWGYNAAVTTHTLETHIYRLRQKIEANPADVRILVTVPGGYRLEP
ncbi:MAG TPA: DNA-binding response regulator [Rhodospirillaceae bacterium]|nr:DNA-binding response regulator [Candidatus Neomarinimicrobiota bacterium]HCX14354.1 DNA-binding response regulator [Rhodospirillaceae bacterium]